MITNPVSVAVGALIILILLGGLVADLNRRRRVSRFGDQSVLGLDRPWYLSVVTPILTSAAAGCVATLSIVPPAEWNVPDDVAEVGIVIDSHLAKAVEGCDAVRAVISQMPPRRVSIWISGPSPALLVPPTADALGALVLVDGSAVREPAAADPKPAKGNRIQIGRLAERVVYVTSETPDEIESAGRDNRSRSRSLAYVVMTGTGALRFGTYDGNGSLSWNSSPVALREFLASETLPDADRGSWLQSLTVSQRLALTGFALIAGLCLWSRFRP